MCPGYRDLGKVLFRDENDRIIRISRKRNGQLKAALTTNQTPDSVVARVSNARHEFVQSVVLSSNISTPLSQPIDDLGAIFFFTKYTYNTPPYSTDYHDWLTQSYLADTPTRAGIEAVGLAGISNTSYTPYIMRKSREKYSEAIVAVKQALNDSDQAIADSTLMAVLLLGVYEVFSHHSCCVPAADYFSYSVSIRLSISKPGIVFNTGPPMSKQLRLCCKSGVGNSLLESVGCSFIFRVGHK